MSSNIEIQRVCEFCGKEFTARTTTTRYCSKPCNKKHYDQLKRAKKIANSNAEVLNKKNISTDDINKKDVLTVKDTASLLNLSLRSVYRLIKKGTIKASNIGKRMNRIQRKDINELLDSYNQPSKKRFHKLSDCYTLEQIQEKYNLSEKSLYDIIRRREIERIKHGACTYIPKKPIDYLFSKHQ